ncbi:MAG: ABC transporter permease [Planctomycetota bacterium]
MARTIREKFSFATAAKLGKRMVAGVWAPRRRLQGRGQSLMALIIAKELRHSLFSYKFSIVTVLSTVLILASTYVMYRDYCLARDNYEILRSESEEDVAVIPPTPLSIFARGLDENLCRSFEVGGIDIGVSSKQQLVNEIFKLFTAPDLFYIIKVILSLCAMLFAFDMVSGEKEMGTLRQSLSVSLARPILIIGKWVGGFISFILPFLIAVLLSMILVTQSPRVSMSTQDWAKLGLFLISSAVYLAVFFSLGLLVSCLTHQSSLSLVISLFVWTILVFVIPNLGVVLARQLVEMPTVQQLELRRTYNRRKASFETDRAEGLERHRIEQRAETEADQLTEEYRNRFNRLAMISQNITRISPAAAFTFLATDTMGTGMAEERRLKRAVLQYNYATRNWRADSPPAFRYQRSACREALGPGGLGNLLILVLFGILSCTGAYVAFLRYDVR